MYKCSICSNGITATTEGQRRYFKTKGRIYCSDGCKEKGREISRKASSPVRVWPSIECSECGSAVVLDSAYRRTRFKRTGRVYCSTDCSGAYKARVSSETMARTNRKFASERMKLNNPMRKPEIRNKVSAKLREIGHSPKVRGGNGQDATDAEKILYLLFSDLGFVNQCAVPTKMPRNSGYPTCYKIDCGNAELKVGIEADGRSHESVLRKTLDRKKDDFLIGLGWKIFRFQNEKITEEPDSVFEEVTQWLNN